MDYPIHPAPFTDVRFEDAFWLPRLETNRTVTIPYDFAKCEETGRVANFLKAAGKMEGPHQGLMFNDSDVFKVLEGAAYSLHLHPDPELDAYLDDLIAKIAAAQEDDGYLYTARTIDPSAVTTDREGLTRWSRLQHNHELYNLGHMYEAAVAHYQATGKRNFLDIALKSADLVYKVFGLEKKRDVPGHQEIELGLVKLYRVTGEERYLNLAKFFLDERGQHETRKLYAWDDIEGYNQDHLPVTEQEEAVGHAVRAVYMYSAVADVAALTGDEGYLKALETLWDNVASKKLYLTGGLGARHHGEAFGENFELPDATAYNETCAAIANVYWNQRMFLLHGDAKYVDVLERTLYNGFLAGVSLSGDEFFYANPLASDGEWAFNVKTGATRSPWFDCSCCPTNVVRFVPALLGYVYASRNDTVYVNLFVGSEGSVELEENSVQLTQETNYPWDGHTKLTMTPEQAAEFTLALRVPGWAQNRPVPSELYRYLEPSDEQVSLMLNGEPVRLELEQGFACIRRTWQAGDVVTLNLPMPVRRVVADDRVEADRGKVAVERGPLLYCAEGMDNGGRALDLVLPDDVDLSPHSDETLLGGVTIIRGGGLTLIPYYAWSHRGVGEMVVWLQRS